MRHQQKEVATAVMSRKPEGTWTIFLLTYTQRHAQEILRPSIKVLLFVLFKDTLDLFERQCHRHTDL